MRDLHDLELSQVSGAGHSPCPPSKKPKGNNGFGNGGDANRAAPGNSGGTPGDKDGSPIR